MGRHVCDLLEALAQLAAPACHAARPHVALALVRLERVAVGVASEALALSDWLDAVGVRVAPPEIVATGTSQITSADPRINVARRGAC